MSPKIVYLLTTLLLLSLASCEQQDKLIRKVVEIQPVALDVLVPLYDNVVVLFVKDIGNSKRIQLFEKAVAQLTIEDDIAAKTLFGLCDIQKDLAGHLKKYEVESEGIKFFTQVNQYELSLPESSGFDFQAFSKFFNSVTKPTLPWYNPDSAAKSQQYQVVFKVFSQQQFKQAQQIYRRAYHYLKLFGVNSFYQMRSLPQINIDIEYEGKQKETYPKSAVEALFNFTEKGVAEYELGDFVDFINVATIDEVSQLDEKNYYRVFGSQLDSQLLLIYREKDSKDEQIEGVRKIFREAAAYNKAEQMKFERVLFAEATIEFLQGYFADTMLEENQKYSIILTKTEYSNFQLRKFEYKGTPQKSQNLITFLDDVRQNKVQAAYNSEPLPEKNDEKKIRKIVGKNFIEEVFQQQNKSVLVLFIDSKDPESYKEIYQALDAFSQKFSEAYKEKLNLGIFDLAKNQHQSLTIRKAPELVLFQRSNKKKPKFFRGQPTVEIIKNFVNYQVKDVTIPDNFGEKILPLGGGEL